MEMRVRCVNHHLITAVPAPSVFISTRFLGVFRRRHLRSEHDDAGRARLDVQIGSAGAAHRGARSGHAKCRESALVARKDVRAAKAGTCTDDEGAVYLISSFNT